MELSASVQGIPRALSCRRVVYRRAAPDTLPPALPLTDRMLAKLGVPTARYATPLHAADYYAATYVNPTVLGTLLSNVQGQVAYNLKVWASWLSGLPSAATGIEVTAPQALAALQTTFGQLLLLTDSTVDFNSEATTFYVLSGAYDILAGGRPAVGKTAANGNGSNGTGRRLREAQQQQQVTTGARSFTSANATAAALSTALGQLNALLHEQQVVLVQALDTNTTLSVSQLADLIMQSTKVINVLANGLPAAAQRLASGNITAEQFISQYSGAALRALVAQQQVNWQAPGGGQEQEGEGEEKSNTGLIVGLVVGLVGGAVVVAAAAVYILRRRRRQVVAAPAVYEAV